MSRFVAFLRAINVGGHTVTMEALRRRFEALGFSDVETFIASGNVIFTAESRAKASAGARSISALETRIESALEAALGYEVKTFLRSDAEVAAIARCTPFPAARMKAAVALNVGFLKTSLDAAGTKTLMGLKTEIDDFHVHGREVYWICAMRQSDSRFTNVRFERLLKLDATFRGLNTLARIAAKYPPPAQ